MNKNEWPLNLLITVCNHNQDWNKYIPPKNDFLASIEYVLYLLPEMERTVIIDRFKYKMTQKEIANNHDISISRVCKLEHRAIRRLRLGERPYILYNGIEKYIDKKSNELVGTKTLDLANKPDYDGKFDTPLNEILVTNISDLGLSTRAFNCLSKVPCHTVNDILKYEETLVTANIWRMGEVTRQEVIDKMHDIGFKSFGNRYK